MKNFKDFFKKHVEMKMEYDGVSHISFQEEQLTESNIDFEEYALLVNITLLNKKSLEAVIFYNNYQEEFNLLKEEYKESKNINEFTEKLNLRGYT